MNRFCSRFTILLVISFSLLFQQQVFCGKKDEETPPGLPGKLTLFHQAQEPTSSQGGFSISIDTRTHQAQRIQPIDARMERMSKQEMEKEIEWLLTIGRATLYDMIETQKHYPDVFDRTPKRKAIFEAAKAQLEREQAQQRTVKHKNVGKKLKRKRKFAKKKKPKKKKKLQCVLSKKQKKKQ